MPTNRQPEPNTAGRPNRRTATPVRDAAYTTRPGQISTEGLTLSYCVVLYALYTYCSTSRMGMMSIRILSSCVLHLGLGFLLRAGNASWPTLDVNEYCLCACSAVIVVALSEVFQRRGALLRSIFSLCLNWVIVPCCSWTRAFSVAIYPMLAVVSTLYSLWYSHI